MSHLEVVFRQASISYGMFISKEDAAGQGGESASRPQATCGPEKTRGRPRRVDEEKNRRQRGGSADAVLVHRGEGARCLGEGEGPRRGPCTHSTARSDCAKSSAPIARYEVSPRSGMHREVNTVMFPPPARKSSGEVASLCHRATDARAAHRPTKNRSGPPSLAGNRQKKPARFGFIRLPGARAASSARSGSWPADLPPYRYRG